MEFPSEKPNLRSKGSRFNIQTGNTVKFSVQDQRLGAAQYGYLRREILRDAHTETPFDEFVPGVEYSLNKRNRWEILDQPNLRDVARSRFKNGSSEVLDNFERELRRWSASGLYKWSSKSKFFSMRRETQHGNVVYADISIDHPRLRRGNRTRFSSALSRYRLQRVCFCRNCRKQRRLLQTQRKLPKHARSWLQTLKDMALHGPKESVRKDTDIEQIVVVCAPLVHGRFPMHMPVRHYHSKQKSARKGKSLPVTDKSLFVI